MQTRDGASIALFRALSVYTFIRALELFSQNLTHFLGPKNHITLSTVIETITPVVLLVIGGLLIWHLAPKIAASISKSAGGNDKWGLSLGEIYNIVFCVTGIFLLVDGLPLLVRTVVFIYQIEPLSRVDNLMRAERNSWIAISLLKLGLGFWLLLGSRGIAEFVRRKNAKR
jgi:hypothetical protein